MMSRNGHAVPEVPAPEGPTAMMVGGGRLPAGLWFDSHSHPQHQIAWAARGVIAVETEHGRWLLPPTRALWIPGGLAHRTGTTEGARMRGIYVEPERCPVDFTAPTMVRVGPLLRELFERLAAPPDADTHDPVARRTRLEAVVFDLLEPVTVVPVGARPPRDPRARRVAELLRADPADPRTLTEWAALVALAPRTLARHFQEGTGLGFAQWRTRIRVEASLPLLAGGMPVARIAPRVGYATASAYVAAFRRTIGVPPGRYFTG